MLWTPVTLAAGTSAAAEGGTLLNAFDNGLSGVGIGNINLVKLSSIMPPAIRVVPLPRIKPGALIPTAYAAMVSDVPGEIIGAAIGWALPEDPEKAGVIMEVHDRIGAKEAKRMIERMLAEAFQVRGARLRERTILAAEHRVERAGCAVAAVILLSPEDLLDPGRH